jgi:hypothetical protein
MGEEPIKNQVILLNVENNLFITAFLWLIHSIRFYQKRK